MMVVNQPLYVTETNVTVVACKLYMNLQLLHFLTYTDEQLIKVTTTVMKIPLFIGPVPVQFMLYSLGMDCIENTACNSSSVVACVSVAIDMFSVQLPSSDFLF
jgi:hypothetical protein